MGSKRLTLTTVGNVASKCLLFVVVVVESYLFCFTIIEFVLKKYFCRIHKLFICLKLTTILSHGTTTPPHKKSFPHACMLDVLHVTIYSISYICMELRIRIPSVCPGKHKKNYLCTISKTFGQHCTCFPIAEMFFNERKAKQTECLNGLFNFTSYILFLSALMPPSILIHCEH